MLQKWHFVQLHALLSRKCTHKSPNDFKIRIQPPQINKSLYVILGEHFDYIIL